MKDMAIIGDLSFSLGFRLLGLPKVVVVENQREFEDNLIKLFEDKNVGIIVAQKEFLDNLRMKVKKFINTKTYPVLVSFSLEGGEEEDIDKLIKRALGFEIK